MKTLITAIIIGILTAVIPPVGIILAVIWAIEYIGSVVIVKTSMQQQISASAPSPEPKPKEKTKFNYIRRRGIILKEIIDYKRQMNRNIYIYQYEEPDKETGELNITKVGMKKLDDMDKQDIMYRANEIVNEHIDKIQTQGKDNTESEESNGKQ